MITIGIDLAAQPENTAACAIVWKPDRAEIQKMICNLVDADVLEFMSKAHKALGRVDPILGNSVIGRRISS